MRRTSVQTGRDLMGLLNAAIFNVILGNADAHAKNFSLLYTDEGPRLAPLYDLMSTAFYPELASEFAMKIGKAVTLETLGPRDWRSFAERVDVGVQVVQRQVQELAGKVSAAVPSVLAALEGQGFDASTLDLLGAMVRGRADQCRKRV